MTCTHINQAITSISILVNSGVIYKETDPFLKIEKVMKFMESRWTNAEEWELNQISDKIRIIDEASLKDELEKIKEKLDDCSCFNEKKSEMSRKIEAMNEEIKEKELNLVSIKKDNKNLIEEKIRLEEEIKSLKIKNNEIEIKLESMNEIISENEENLSQIKSQKRCLKGSIIDQGTKLAEIEIKKYKEKITKKEEDLTKLLKEIEGGEKGWKKEVRKLEDLYKQLADAIYEKDRDEIKKIGEKIADSKGELEEKGIDSEDVSKITKICKEISELNLELAKKGEVKEKYEAKIETPLMLLEK